LGRGCDGTIHAGCADGLGLYRGAVTPDADVVIWPPDIDVTAGTVRGVESYWGSGIDIQSEQDTTIGSLSGHRFTLVQRGATFVVMRGRLKTGCYEARVSYVRRLLRVASIDGEPASRSRCLTGSRTVSSGAPSAWN
jgi:hypothetical protein